MRHPKLFTALALAALLSITACTQGEPEADGTGDTGTTTAGDTTTGGDSAGDGGPQPNLTAYYADAHQLVSLSADVYLIAYVPFQISLIDSATVGLGAILISYLATLYPSRAASRLQPVEAFRYE